MPATTAKASPDLLLAPFVFHGVVFSRESMSGQAIGPCPFCGEDRKFYVDESNGCWDCKDCKRSGNHTTFLRQIYDLSTSTTPDDYQALAEERGYLDARCLEEWGIVRSAFDTEWLIPTYSIETGEITQLYRYAIPDRHSTKKRLMPTAGIRHHIFGVNLYDSAKPDLYLCESLWDAVILRETLKTIKEENGRLVFTGAEIDSLSMSSNVLAAPGCRVFYEGWSRLFGGKRTFLLYHNDYPRTVTYPNGTSQVLPPDALEGMKAVAGTLSRAETLPTEVHYLKWGTGSVEHDPTLKKGYDIRDSLTGSPHLTERVAYWASLYQRLELIPSEWLGGKVFSEGSVQLTTLDCTDWRTLVMSWRRALKMTWGLEKTLAVMLASILSTGHADGDQVWLKVMSTASSGKSTLCEAISIAREWIFPTSSTTRFHSGYKSDKEGKEDHSLIPKLRNKTLIVKDGDSFLNAGNRDQILSELRDLFDKCSRKNYGHGINRNYEDVPLTFILCGTGGLRSIDQSELGERFLNCYIMKEIDPQLERTIQRRSGYSVRDNFGVMSNGAAESRESEEKIEAKRLTGGYIDYLRKNAASIMKSVKMDDEACEKCFDYAAFIAHMRARPSKKQDEDVEREFSPRLSNQLILLAGCIAGVLNRPSVDDFVMRHIHEVTADTAGGKTLNLVHHLARVGQIGADTAAMSVWMSEETEKQRVYLAFLERIKVVENFSPEIAEGIRGHPRWRLTPQISRLYSIFLGGT